MTAPRLLIEPAWEVSRTVGQDRWCTCHEAASATLPVMLVTVSDSEHAVAYEVHWVGGRYALCHPWLPEVDEYADDEDDMPERVVDEWGRAVLAWVNERGETYWRAEWQDETAAVAKRETLELTRQRAQVRSAVAHLPAELVRVGVRLTRDGWVGTPEELRKLAAHLAGTGTLRP